MILELLIAAQIVSSAPPLSPAEAAQVMARLDSPANATGRFVCLDCDGPHVIVISSRPQDGPFGAFEPFPPPRRLDGTLISSKPSHPAVYVSRLFGTQRTGGSDRRRRR
jgi:hypothetical protein